MIYHGRTPGERRIKIQRPPQLIGPRVLGVHPTSEYAGWFFLAIAVIAVFFSL